MALCAGAPSRKVPFVEPRSSIATSPLLTIIWQCKLETEASAILKSVPSPRPKRFAPSLSWISQESGLFGLTTSRFIIWLVGSDKLVANGLPLFNPKRAIRFQAGASHLGGVFLGFNFLVARSKGPNWARWMAKATHSSVRWRNALNAATRAVTSLSEPARTKRQVNLP